MKIRKNLAEALIYVSAYAGGAPFAIVGGFFFLKCKDNGIKKPLKIALLLFAVFLGAEALAFVLQDLFSAIEIWNVSYWVDLAIDLSKMVLFGLMAISAFFSKNKDYYELDGFSGDE